MRRPEDGSPDREDRSALAERLCAVVASFHSRGWCFGTSGNFSVVLGREPLRLLITPSGRHKHRLGPDDLLEMDGRARPLEGANATPSAEALLHCRIAARTDAGSILHTHSVASTLLGEHYLERGGFRLGGYEMLKGLKGIRTHEDEIFIPVVENSQDMDYLGARVDEVFDRHERVYGFLIAGHGLYTWGVTLPEAERHVEILEFLLELAARRTPFRSI